MALTAPDAPSAGGVRRYSDEPPPRAQRRPADWRMVPSVRPRRRRRRAFRSRRHHATCAIDAATPREVEVQEVPRPHQMRDASSEIIQGDHVRRVVSEIVMAERGGDGGVHSSAVDGLLGHGEVGVHDAGVEGVPSREDEGVGADDVPEHLLAVVRRGGGGRAAERGRAVAVVEVPAAEGATRNEGGADERRAGERVGARGALRGGRRARARGGDPVRGGRGALRRREGRRAERRGGHARGRRGARRKRQGRARHLGGRESVKRRTGGCRRRLGAARDRTHRRRRAAAQIGRQAAAARPHRMPWRGRDAVASRRKRSTA